MTRAAIAAYAAQEAHNVALEINLIEGLTSRECNVGADGKRAGNGKGKDQGRESKAVHVLGSSAGGTGLAPAKAGRKASRRESKTTVMRWRGASKQKKVKTSPGCRTSRHPGVGVAILLSSSSR